MDFILTFFNDFWLFLQSIPGLINDLFVYCGAWFVIAWTKAKIEFISFGWQVAQEILTQLNISATLNSYWSSIDSRVMGMVTFFRLPEALNLIMNAWVTRYVLSVLR